MIESGEHSRRTGERDRRTGERDRRTVDCSTGDGDRDRIKCRRLRRFCRAKCSGIDEFWPRTGDGEREVGKSMANRYILIQKSKKI